MSPDTQTPEYDGGAPGYSGDEVLRLMTTYADPTRCPDCRSLLPEAPQICRHCALPLTGATAVELFATLQRADGLLGVLRRRRPGRRPGSCPPALAAPVEAVAPGGVGAVPHSRPERSAPGSPPSTHPG